jgi:hypothetical protein
MRPALGSCLSRAPAILATRLALTLAAGSLCACRDQVLPGDDYGRYKVTGQTTTNTCGAGLDAPNPWVFDAELSRDGNTIYWSWLDNGAPVSGALVSATHASITSSTSANVDGDDAGVSPCALTRADDIEITLPATAPPSTFSGTISYSFAVLSGSTCGDQLASAGGTYAALPCSVSYTFTAALQ